MMLIRAKSFFYNLHPGGWLFIILIALLLTGTGVAQLNVSNNIVNAVQSGTWSSRTQDGSGTAITSTGAALDVNLKSAGSISFGVSTGTNIIGLVRDIPGNCSQTSIVRFSVVQVASGGGTSVTTTTSCIVSGMVNNITNSPVTLRLADQSGTPVIWVGGNADFTIPANSNLALNGIPGVIFTSGITAIAGTGAALNLYLSVLQ
jgi:hypothetical protein